VVIDRLWPGRVPAGPGSGEHPVGWLEFERFCRTAFPPVAAQLHAIIGDRARAHRLAHGAFAEAWRQWDKVSALPDRVSWVRRRAARQIRWSQRCRAVTGLLRRGRSDEPGAAGLLAALTRLPAVQRRALVLHHMAGLTPAQLADEENTSAKVVSQRLEHGRLALGHRAASGDWAKGDADVGAGQWAIAPIDDWVARQFTYLDYRLAPRPDTRAVLIAMRTARQRRRITAVAGAGIILLTGFGTAVAATLSPSRQPSIPLAPASRSDDSGPVAGADLPFMPGLIAPPGAERRYEPSMRDPSNLPGRGPGRSSAASQPRPAQSPPPRTPRPAVPTPAPWLATGQDSDDAP
jgi:RNA polymerase sigma-70 factor (ECF subfamily)